MHIVNGGAQLNDVLVVYSPLSIEAGVTYTIEFDARANPARKNMIVALGTDQSFVPQTTFKYFQVGMGTSTHTTSLTFTASTNAPCVQLTFALGGEGEGDVCIDNVVFEPVGASSVTRANPALVTATSPVSLRSTADQLGLRIGSVASREVDCDAEYAGALAREFNLTKFESAMTFDYLRPEPDVWSFRDTDILVDFATRNGMQLDVNPLTMQKPLPTWLIGASLNAAQVRAILQDHITTLVGRYAGRIRSWESGQRAFGF